MHNGYSGLDPELRSNMTRNLKSPDPGPPGYRVSPTRTRTRSQLQVERKSTQAWTVVSGRYLYTLPVPLALAGG